MIVTVIASAKAPGETCIACTVRLLKVRAREYLLPVTAIVLVPAFSTRPEVCRGADSNALLSNILSGSAISESASTDDLAVRLTLYCVGLVQVTAVGDPATVGPLPKAAMGVEARHPD